MEACNICALGRAPMAYPFPRIISPPAVLLAATVHLMASVPNTILLEMDTSGNAVYEELLTWAPSFEDGTLKVPDCTGLGVALPEAVRKQYGTG